MGRTRNGKDGARRSPQSSAYRLQSGMSLEVGQERKYKTKQVSAAVGADACLERKLFDPRLTGPFEQSP